MTELEFLAAIKSYVENAEEVIDGEHGDCRSISQLIADGKMPEPIYSEIIHRIEAFHPKSRQDHLLDQARSIHNEIEVFVFGPSGTETPACAEAWSTAKLIAELRSRVEALESAQRPTVKDSLTVPADSLTAPVTRDRAEDAPESLDSLVKRVADAITDVSAAYGTADEPEARAAIHAVADWSEQQGLRTAADWLRQEVG